MGKIDVERQRERRKEIKIHVLFCTYLFLDPNSHVCVVHCMYNKIFKSTYRL